MMASTFWIGTNVKVTNGSATVEVTSGDVITKVKENAMFVASNFSLPYEVDRTYTNNGKDYIVLKEDWQGASGTGLNAVAVTSPAGIEEARQTLINLISVYEGFANDVKPTVEGDAIVQRTSAGRIKTANAVSSDEAVAYGQLGSAATKNVGESYGDVMEVGAFGIGASGKGMPNDTLTDVPNGIYRLGNSNVGLPSISGDTVLCTKFGTGNNNARRVLFGDSRIYYKAADTAGVFGDTIEFLTDSNTGSVVTKNVVTSPQETTSDRIITTNSDFNFYALRDYGGYYPSTSPRNIDTVPSGDSGLYSTGSGGSYPSNPSIGFYYIKTQQMYTNKAKSQFAIGYYGSYAGNDAPTYSMRTMDNTGEGWTPWANFYHSSNVNLNEFGGAGAHSVIATGVGRTLSEILFYLPINSFTEPTGISVKVGFNIRGENNIAIGNENLFLSNTFSGTLSSTRYCVLIVGGLSNIEVGTTYRLQTVNNLSKLTVNF